LRAARSTDLTESATAGIDLLERQLRAGVDGVDARREYEAFHVDLVASVRAGRLDTARLHADEAAFERAEFALRERQIGAIRQLHDVLNPVQRQRTADAIRASMRSSYEHLPPLSPAAGDGGAPDRAARRLQQMRVQLGLDDEQGRQLGLLLSRRDAPPHAAAEGREGSGGAAKRQMDSLLLEFEKDEFVPRDVDLSPVGRNPMNSMAKEVTFIEQLLNILSSDQTVKLADLMEKESPRGPRSGGVEASSIDTKDAPSARNE
jgi:Spy/CpxP family protein refolding chaperone